MNRLVAQRAGKMPCEKAFYFSIFAKAENSATGGNGKTTGVKKALVIARKGFS
jgi:hypothetical protein